MKMSRKIQVKVIDRRSRGRFELRWPGGGRYASATTKAEAYREAFELEQRLNNPTHEVLSWEKACTAYEDWHLAEWSEDHRKAWGTARRRFEAWANGAVPDVPDITNYLLAAFVADVSRSVAPASIRTYCRYLRGFFNWCRYQDWIEKAPQFKLARQKRGAKRSRGRPLTGEEFDRMLAKIPEVVGPSAAASWELLCRGLWESSLRLSEAMELHWTSGPVRIDFPIIKFVEGDKGGHFGLPITRELWALIEGMPQRGHVFRPQLSKGVTRSRDTWCHRIGDFGRAAGIIVSVNAQGKKKFASAHDLRRSFLENWRGKVPLDVLQIMARHESIETTKRYYLGDEAQRVAAAIWQPT